VKFDRYNRLNILKLAENSISFTIILSCTAFPQDVPRSLLFSIYAKLCKQDKSAVYGTEKMNSQ
jgi:hypothetical protein